MKNIYITDLDHTFLKTDLSISDYTKKIWNSYADESIMSVATARTYKKTMQFIDGIEVNAPMILLDGALIATADKKIIDTKFISQDVGNMIIDEGSKLGIYPFVIALADENLNEAFLHSTVLNKHQQAVLKRYSVDDNIEAQSDLSAMENNFKMVYMGEEDLLLELSENLENIFGPELKYSVAPEAYTGCHFLTILHHEADKSHGIKSVSEYLGFDLERLSVFGDNFNDMGMFELAGTSVAMANAQVEVKDMASVVLKHSNDEDGVAKYLESLKNG